MNKSLSEQIQQAQNNILKSTIDLVTEKELWKKRALSLAQQSKLCFKCGTPKDWNPTTLQCERCVKEVHE